MKNKYNVIHLDIIDSTNEYIKREYENLDGCTLVIADRQTQGRGRNDRHFSSTHEGIFMSMYVTGVDFSFTKMSACVGVAIVESLIELYGIRPKIKWVNDIILDHKKLGGILCETSYKSGQLEYVVIGIGLNIDEVLDMELKDKSTYLNKYTVVNKELLIDTIWKHFFGLIDSEYIFIAKYRKYSNTIGRRVRVQESSSSYTARAVGIDDEGCLLVSLEDGSLKKLASGEIHIHEGVTHEN